MKQINPLYIGAFLLLATLFLLIKIESYKNEIIQADKKYNEIEHLASNLHKLKSIYADTQKSKRTITRILANQKVKNAHLNITKTKNAIVLSHKSLNAQTAHYLLSKILNNSLKITRLQLKRETSTTLSLNLELAW